MGTCSSNQVDKNIKSQSRPGHFTTVATNVSPNGITPRVGFVIKTNCSYKSKVFINLFYHEFVKEMCVISASKSYDKKGESCFVYGIIVPYALYTSNCQTNALRVQMCTDAITLINRKYNDTLSFQFKTPKVTKGYIGLTLPENINLPQENLLITKVSTKPVRINDAKTENKAASDPVVISSVVTKQPTARIFRPIQTPPTVFGTWARLKTDKYLKTYYFQLKCGILSWSETEPTLNKKEVFEGFFSLKHYEVSLSSADSDKCVVTLTLQPNAIIGRSTISPTTFSPQTTVVVSDSDCNSNSGSKASLSSPGTKLHRQICILFVDSVSQSHWLNQYHKHKSWACDHSTNKA